MRDNRVLKRLVYHLIRRSRSLITLAALTVLLLGCSNQVEVTGDFPRPMVNQLPYTLGVFYPPEFSSYQYIEKNEDRDKRTIGLGSVQTKLFATLLPALFKKVVPVSQVQTNPGVDLVLTMAVDDFQYTLPGETKIKMVEIWMKYNMQLYDPQGQLIADWILTAYGKSPTELMKSESEAINQAMMVTLRDAGAGFSTSFSTVPEIRQWLQQHAKNQI